LELASDNISAFKYYPLYEDDDPTKKVIGTLSIVVNESDFGGAVPKWLVQKFFPSSFHDMFEDVVQGAKKQ
jgi:hypothetical protein